MILHVDMDAFYASVEQLDRPELRGRCVIVGGTRRRGVVSAASYEARKCGVHSAMPVFQARRQCPQGIFVTPRMERYREVSHQVMTVLRSFSPLVEPVSIDEAFIDISGCDRLFGPPTELAQTVKHRIRDTTGLTCSVGVAPVKFLAKIASDMDKPDGLTLIEADEVASFIARLAIDKVPGVGVETAEVLRQMGIITLGDVRSRPQADLERRLGRFGARLARLADGCDDSPVVPEHDPHSISSEMTLSVDTRDRSVLHRHMLHQSETVSRQLRRKGFRARTVMLKIKHADFTQVTRRRTLERPTQSGRELYAAACGLLAAYPLPDPVRLIGVGAAGLVSEYTPSQRSLFDDRGTRSGDGWEKAERAMDAIADKFGSDAVTRAALVDEKSLDDDP